MPLLGRNLPLLVMLLPLLVNDRSRPEGGATISAMVVHVADWRKGTPAMICTDSHLH